MRSDPQHRSRAVLITGCSSGIGRATALALLRSARPVYASARRVESIASLAEAGCRVLALDVNDEASMIAAVKLVEAEHGAIDVLVNNAGYGLYGPIEQQSIAEVRRLFETNVLGPARLTQLVLPSMRRQGRGTILNVSSMGGRTVLPGGGYYHASKYALEAMSDALRLEVAPFGIDVILVEPGSVRTPWNEVALESLTHAVTGEDEDPYEEFKNAVSTTLTSVMTGPLPWYASRPEDVARKIERVLRSSHPRTRYLINPSAKLLVKLKEWLPDRAYDALLRKQFRLSRPHRRAVGATSAPGDGQGGNRP